MRIINRLRTTGGRYLLKSHDIEINPKQYEHYGKKAIIDIVKHELCHYHLHILGKKVIKHKDRDFKMLKYESWCAPRFCTPIHSYEERANYEYKCPDVGQKYLRIKRVNVSMMRMW